MRPTTPEPTWRTRAFVEHTMGMAVSLHIRVAHDEFGSRTDELADAAHRAFAALHRAVVNLLRERLRAQPPLRLRKY